MEGGHEIGSGIWGYHWKELYEEYGTDIWSKYIMYSHENSKAINNNIRLSASRKSVMLKEEKWSQSPLALFKESHCRLPSSQSEVSLVYSSWENLTTDSYTENTVSILNPT